MGIVGESGSGKSVTSLSVMGLIEPPGYVAGGSITFKGRELSGLPDKAMRNIRGRDIGFVFQDPMTALNPVYRVGAQVAEALRAHQRWTGAPPWSAWWRCSGRWASPRQNSGCRTIPAICPVACGSGWSSRWRMINEPDLLILDEPTTALDATVQAQILDLIADVRARVNTSVLLIIPRHRRREAGVLGDHRDVRRQGHGAWLHGADRRRPRHPYTIGLLARCRRRRCGGSG